jgi:hypothetical protein
LIEELVGQFVGCIGRCLENENMARCIFVGHWFELHTR